MKTILILVIALLSTLAQGGDLPWIGVSFKSPSPEDRRSASLKSGVGFQATDIVANGPLAKAGGKNGDLWWKFDEQILVNMGQMVVLLREKKAGETVKVKFFRDGKLQELDLILGLRRRPQVMPVSMVPEDANAEKSRRLAKRERVARLNMNEQTLSLESEGERWRFKVTEGQLIVLSALVSNDDFGVNLPKQWLGAFMILKHTLQRGQALGEATTEERVRFVPKDTEKSSIE